MNILKATFAVASLMLTAIVVADENIEMKIKIDIDDGSGGEPIFLSLDSETMGFALHDMQVGEIQSVVDETGRSILITREADGIKFEVDGTTINMPLFSTEHESMWIDDGNFRDIDVQIHRIGGFFGHESSDGIVIISGKTIDDATQESIRSLLLSSGHDGGVEFIDGGAMGGGIHKKIVIKRKIAATQ